MKVSIPLTGTLVSYNPIIGSDADPVRLIELDLGNVEWTLLSLDLERDLALIEVTPAEEVDDEEKHEARPTTKKEKQAELDKIWKIMADNSIDKLYKISGSTKLKKPK